MLKKILHYSIFGLGLIVMLVGLFTSNTWMGLAGFWQFMCGVDLVFKN